MRALTHYIIGFALSLVLTLVPAAFVWLHTTGEHSPSMHVQLPWVLVIFALTQLLVQLYFFLHVGDEEKPRWNVMALCFAVFIAAVLVGGTLWIMQNLGHEQQAQLPFIENTISAEASND
ncbi:MAG: cytochrome o ubiquinol oxidase subunit [Candidatus Adlerbacteria bacterium]|nr:cytochrome o ubiquinol oxidase subunit [Candidatus Adlerbacteria bacterium]